MPKLYFILKHFLKYLLFTTMLVLELIILRLIIMTWTDLIDLLITINEIAFA